MRGVGAGGLVLEEGILNVEQLRPMLIAGTGVVIPRAGSSCSFST